MFWTLVGAIIVAVIILYVGGAILGGIGLAIAEAMEGAAEQRYWERSRKEREREAAEDRARQKTNEEQWLGQMVGCINPILMKSRRYDELYVVMEVDGGKNPMIQLNVRTNDRDWLQASDFQVWINLNYEQRVRFLRSAESNPAYAKREDKRWHSYAGGLPGYSPETETAHSPTLN